MLTIDVRPEVAAFALLMEKRLRENDHKPGWKNDHALGLFRRLGEETAELEAQLGLMFSDKPKHHELTTQAIIGSESADVANFAMMVADVSGALAGFRSGPEIVCLCGSTRFADEMNQQAQHLTLGGAIVVRPEVVTYDRGTDPQHVAPAVKAKLDELHLRKIDLADRVLVVNVGGYIGDSTRREIDYARSTGKPVTYTEPPRG